MTKSEYICGNIINNEIAVGTESLAPKVREISALVVQTMSLTSTRETTSSRSVRHSPQRIQNTSSLKMDHSISSTST
jgi:hypothetical protein